MNAKGKVIATDLDGTLFYPKKRWGMISHKNLKFLRKFIDGGGHVLLISGRNVNYLEKTKRKIKRDIDYAGCNGAFISVKGQFIKRFYLDNTLALKTLRAIKKKYPGVAFLVMSEKYNFVFPREGFSFIYAIGYFVYRLNQGVYRELTIRDDRLHDYCLEHERNYKIMIYFGVSKKSKALCYQACETFKKLYPAFDFSYNGPSIEMTNGKATKGKAIKQYLDYLKIKHDNVMVVGDSGNDISMFHQFPNSFVM
ncbi:MAG: Cof-type HAD-IIB family hydrolase, partial [Bacilli bacterium]|nr:Cof-type HAD-IIB family hydrolase [Bacilli bacterium]